MGVPCTLAVAVWGTPATRPVMTADERELEKADGPAGDSASVDPHAAHTAHDPMTIAVASLGTGTLHLLRVRRKGKGHSTLVG